MKNITFITTGQPTTNPRLVKEAETLHKLGYNVKVICCFYQLWAQEPDKEITDKNPGMYIYCGGDPVRQKARYFKTRVRQKLCQLLFSYLKKFGVAENAISRTHADALAIAKKINTDIFIAHNLGALPTAVLAAKHLNAKIGYDAEDMHSAQFTSDTDRMYLLNKYIEEKYFGSTNYFTAASPLIAQYYTRQYPYLNPVVINNTFPKVSFDIKNDYKQNGPLKLFWFSQTIGPGRGLETVIEALAGTGSNVQLHLLGNCLHDDMENLISIARRHNLNNKQLQFHNPVSADALLALTAQFHIGLATETGVPVNRDICLTNKIFTYIQCGLALIASNTKAQTLFMQQYPAAGKIYDKNDVQSLTDCINTYANNPQLLHETRLNNYNLGQSDLNWETESNTFINLVKSL